LYKIWTNWQVPYRNISLGCEPRNSPITPPPYWWILHTCYWFPYLEEGSNFRTITTNWWSCTTDALTNPPLASTLIRFFEIYFQFFRDKLSIRQININHHYVLKNDRFDFHFENFSFFGIYQLSINYIYTI
jgi:hypothetical protein